MDRQTDRQTDGRTDRDKCTEWREEGGNGETDVGMRCLLAQDEIEQFALACDGCSLPMCQLVLMYHVVWTEGSAPCCNELSQRQNFTGGLRRVSHCDTGATVNGCATLVGSEHTAAKCFLHPQAAVVISPSTCDTSQWVINFKRLRQLRSGCASGARFTKYLTTILQLSYDNAKVTIDLRRTSNLQNVLRRTRGFSEARFTCKVVRSSETVFAN